MKNFYVGDKIYFYYDMIRQICAGTIESSYYDSNLSSFIYKIHMDCGGEVSCIDEYVFNSFTDCDKYVKFKNNDTINNHLKEINSEDDLVLFCLNHNVCLGEYCDYEARLAAKTKAIEFGIIKENE